MIYEELNQGNKERAIAEIRQSDGYLDYNWYEATDHDFKEILKRLGYYEIETRFSGFSSQGDGASFKGMYAHKLGSCKSLKSYARLDTELHRISKELLAIQKKCKYDLGSNIDFSSSNYCHEMTMTNLNWSNHDRVGEDLVDSFDKETLELHRDLARWYYKALEEDYDYLMSDEAVIDHIEANNIDFDYEDDDNEDY